MKWIALDPGLLNCGYAYGEDDKVLGGGCFHQPKAPKKRNLKSAADDFERTRHLTHKLAAVMDAQKPNIICFESFSPPRHASSGAKIARSLGVIAGIAELAGLPTAAVSPQEVKEAVLGKRGGTKSDIRGALTRIYGEEALGVLLFAVRGELQEHPIDALGVWHACKKSDIYRACASSAHYPTSSENGSGAAEPME